MLTSKAPQNYPRVAEGPADEGLLDESALVPHVKSIPNEKLRAIVRNGIRNAADKSSRDILSIPEDATNEAVERIYHHSGKELFRYFIKYCGDPASTAYQYYGRHYRDVAREQFHNRSLQKERMNSGWRYQFIAKDCASESGRFESVSDIGTAEADFNVTIRYARRTGILTIYVSVKNRVNTMGGQDWPKAIMAMENMARSDKNRVGPFICVFGIAMDRGLRHMKCIGNTGVAHSVNTEIWKSDFFWPFFANCSYEEIMHTVLNVMIEIKRPNGIEVTIPEQVLESFGEACRDADLVDEEGKFNDAHKLVSLICGVG